MTYVLVVVISMASASTANVKEFKFDTLRDCKIAAQYAENAWCEKRIAL